MEMSFPKQKAFDTLPRQILYPIVKIIYDIGRMVMGDAARRDGQQANRLFRCATLTLRLSAAECAASRAGGGSAELKVLNAYR
jgi:hypothetical protein